MTTQLAPPGRVLRDFIDQVLKGAEQLPPEVEALPDVNRLWDLINPVVATIGPHDHPQRHVGKILRKHDVAGFFVVEIAQKLFTVHRSKIAVQSCS